MAEKLREIVQKFFDLVPIVPPASVCGVLSGPPHPNVCVKEVGVEAWPMQGTQAINLIQVGDLKRILHPKQVSCASSRPYRLVEKSQFSTSPLWETAITKLAVNAIRDLGADGNSAKIRSCRLLILEPNARFVSEMDTNTFERLFATLILKLPLLGEAGRVTARHGGSEHHYDLSGHSCDIFKWAAFRNDCEFEIRSLHGKALHVWKRIPHQERPPKIIMPLKAQYTRKTLSFAKLKRDDALIARQLREFDQFSMLLVVLAQTQGRRKESRSKEGIFTVNSRSLITQTDHNPIQDFMHLRRDSDDAQVFAVKIVDELDNEVEQFDMKINKYRDIVLNSAPLPNNTTGSELIEHQSSSVSSTCEASALVIWPKNADFAILCESNFLSALQFLRSAVSVPSKFAVETLYTAIGFIADTGNSRKYLTHMLEFSCQLKNCECALKALKQMSTPSKSDDISSSWRASNFGCSSEQQIRAMGSAISVFGWGNIGPAIIEVIESTSLEKFSYAAHFARKAKEYGLDAATLDIINETLLGLLRNKEGFERDLTSTAKFVFSRSLFREQQEQLLDNAKSLPPGSLIKVIHGIDAALEETGICEGALRALRTLVMEYLHKAMNEFCGERKICGTRKFFPYLWFEEDIEKGRDLVKVFSIVLRWRHSIEHLLPLFVDMVVSMNNTRLLKLLMQCNRLATALDDINVRKLMKSLMNHIDYPKPTESNRQTDAYVQGHKAVTEFLRGDELMFSYGGFSGVGEAREFVQGRFYREYNEVEQHSASAAVVGRGSEATVVLEKTNKYYLHQLKIYEEDQGECRRLKRLLSGNRKRRWTSH